MPVAEKQNVACTGCWGNDEVAIMSNFSDRDFDSLESLSSSIEAELPDNRGIDKNMSPRRQREEALSPLVGSFSL